MKENKTKDYMHVLTVQAGEVVRPESKQLEVIKRLLNDNGIKASLSIKIREGQG